MKSGITFLLAITMTFTCFSQDISEEILQQNRKMEAAYNNGELEKIASFYTKQGAIVGPSTEVKGNTAIIAYWKGLEGRHVKWKLENVEITPYKDVVIQRGISYLEYYHNEKIVQSDVRFTLVWVREDNQWKINLDHYSPL